MNKDSGNREHGKASSMILKSDGGLTMTMVLNKSRHNKLEFLSSNNTSFPPNTNPKLSPLCIWGILSVPISGCLRGH